MATLTADDIPDLVKSTRNEENRLKLTDISSRVNHYRAYNRLFRQSQVDIQGGRNIEIPILHEQNNTARFVGLYQTDNDAAQVEGLDKGEVPWRHADYCWYWEENEVDINSGEAVIQDFTRVKRLQALLGWATFMDTWWFSDPPSTTDKLTPYPLKYWITKNVTAAGASDSVAGSGSHSGAAPGSHTTKGGISPTTYDQWKNYTFKFVDVSEEDLMAKWQTMLRRINFEPPLGATYPMLGNGVQHEHLVREAELSAMEKLGKQRNDNLGYDFAPNAPMFGRAPITWCPRLDSDTDAPIYTLDWGVFKSVFRKGKWMKEREAMRAPRQHQVWVIWVDSAFNTICYDLRRLGVGSKAAANA